MLRSTFAYIIIIIRYHITRTAASDACTSSLGDILLNNEYIITLNRRRREHGNIMSGVYRGVFEEIRRSIIIYVFII